MKRKYTRKQILESIVKWSSYLLESKQCTVDELEDVLDEGLLKRAIGAMKRGADAVKTGIKNIGTATKEAMHDLLKTNDGVKQMLMTMKDIQHDVDDIGKVNMYVTLYKDSYPVKDLGMIGKRKLLLVIDRNDTDVKPKTLNDLAQFTKKKLGKAKIKDAIEGIYVVEMPRQAMNESKVTDKIKAMGWSKEQALSKENMKTLKRLQRTTDEVTAEIEKHFASKDADSENNKDSKKSSAKSKAPILFDNKFEKCIADGDNITFKFGKSKQELAADKELQSMFDFD